MFVKSFYYIPLKLSSISNSWVGVSLYAPMGTSAHKCSIVLTTYDNLSSSEKDFVGIYAGISSESSKFISSWISFLKMILSCWPVNGSLKSSALLTNSALYGGSSEKIRLEDEHQKNFFFGNSNSPLY